MESNGMVQARLRRRRIAVVAAASAIVLVGLSRITPAYSAECILRIADVGTGFTGSTFLERVELRGELHASFEEIDQLLRSSDLEHAVAARLRVPHRAVAGKVGVEHDPIAGIYRFQAVGARPGFAKALCNATMEQSLALRVELAKQRVSQIASVEETKLTKYQAALQQTNEQIRRAKSILEQNNFRLQAQRVTAEIADLRASIQRLEQALSVGVAAGGQIVYRAEQEAPVRRLWETIALSASPGLVVPLKIAGA